MNPFTHKGFSPTQLEAFWGPRPEEVDAIAQHAATMLRRIGKVHPTLLRWSPIGRSPARRKPLNLNNAHAMYPLVERGRQMRDDDPTVPLDWGGFMFAMSNSGLEGVNPQTEVLIRVDCGGTSTVVPNNILIEWSPDHPIASSLQSVTAMLDIVVEAWQPDHGGVSCGAYVEATEEQWWDMWTPHVGWLLYLAGRRLSRTDVPSAADVAPMGNGSVVIVRREPVDRAIAEDRELIERVRNELGLPPPYKVHRAGLRKKNP